MDFGTFIAAFGNGYQKMLDKISTGKITFLTKPFFCRALLCAIAKNEDYVIYFDGNKTEGTEENTRTSDAFRSFYAGKPDSKSRRSLHPIAKYLINIKDDKRILDEDKFKCFLTEYTENYSAGTLLENFQKLLPNTSKETLFDDITNEFVQILTEAAAKPDKRCKESVIPFSTTNQISEKDKSVIEDIFKSIKEELDKLIAISISYDFQYYYSQNKDELEKAISIQAGYFFQANHKLHYYCLRYPNIEMIVNLHEKGELINATDFMGWGIPSSSETYAECVNEYLELLEHCISELNNL